MATRRMRTDWDAVERDWRTNKFTNQELGVKYNVSHQAISKQSRIKGWSKDLAKAIQQATNAKLVASLVADEIETSGKNVANTVLVAAEVNTQVILKHRRDIEATRKVAADMLEELQDTKMLAENRELLACIIAGSGASPRDEAEARSVVKRALDFGNRVSSIKTLAETFTKLQTAERTAFSLDDADNKKDDSHKVSDEDLDARILALSNIVNNPN